MADNDGRTSVPPFPSEYRASGLLLHVTSLPSPYGIGDLGSSTFSWIDRLHDAGQSWWQALPLGPTGYGNSPYQAMSSFAGNALLISPGSLISDGLIQASNVQSHFSADVVDYDSVIPFKQRLLETAWANFKAGQRTDRDLAPAYAPIQFGHFPVLQEDDRVPKKSSLGEPEQVLARGRFLVRHRPRGRFVLRLAQPGILPARRFAR